MEQLNISSLCHEAFAFAHEYNKEEESETLYGITDGKSIGTYIEKRFHKYLEGRYEFDKGNSSKGLDFPNLNVDIKVSDVNQPQSSCPFRSASQKIYGLGYSILFFSYEKKNNHKTKKSKLNLKNIVFIMAEDTSDFQLTTDINNILDDDAPHKKEALEYLFKERNLPIDSMEAELLAEEVMKRKPRIGQLSISNALQWRINYQRVVNTDLLKTAEKENGNTKIVSEDESLRMQTI
jgi:hypothetical protein